MAVPLSEVGRHGRLDLIFSSRHGRTVIRDAYCEIPFKITRLHDSHLSGIAHLILMQPTAGLFGGDTTECAIHVESGARILITQQSATKAHPSCGRRAIQTNRIRVEAGDRKSTRLNSSHLVISYAVFCLKKKKKKTQDRQ